MLLSLWNVSAHHAQEIYNLATIGLVAGALITITSLIFLIWSSGLKSRFVNEHMASMLAASEQLRVETAKANERAAEFLMRAQQANTEQEKARLELEQVRKLTAWRRLSSDQHDKIVNTLKGHSISLVLLSPGNDPEAGQYADDLAKALGEAGVSVTPKKAFLPIPMLGLGMSMSHSEAGTQLYMALLGAGLKVNDLPEKDPIMLVVGGRPSSVEPPLLRGD